MLICFFSFSFFFSWNGIRRVNAWPNSMTYWASEWTGNQTNERTSKSTMHTEWQISLKLLFRSYVYIYIYVWIPENATMSLLHPDRRLYNFYRKHIYLFNQLLTIAFNIYLSRTFYHEHCVVLLMCPPQHHIISTVFTYSNIYTNLIYICVW